MAPLRYAAKFDPFLSLDCAGVEGVGHTFCHLATLCLLLPPMGVRCGGGFRVKRPFSFSFSLSPHPSLADHPTDDRRSLPNKFATAATEESGGEIRCCLRPSDEEENCGSGWQDKHHLGRNALFWKVV